MVPGGSAGLCLVSTLLLSQTTLCMAASVNLEFRLELNSLSILRNKADSLVLFSCVHIQTTCVFSFFVALSPVQVFYL
jgi:hypothetical protein